MLIQIIVLLVIVISGLNLHNDVKGRKTYIWVCSMVLLLKTSLRSITIGSDTNHYAYYFEQSKNISWSTVLNDFFERYQHLSGYEDMGYYLLQKIFSTFIGEFHIYTFVIQGLLFFLPLGILIYKNSKDNLQVMFAYVLMDSLFMGLPMANARQVYSIGLCIWAVMFFAQKKYIRAIIFVMLGYFIHMSALLFFIPIILSLVDDKKLKAVCLISLILSFFVLANPNTIIFFMGNMVENDKYASYGMGETQGGALTYILLSLMMSAFCMFAYWKKSRVSREEKMLYIMIPPTTFFTPLIYSNGSMMRITLYYQIFFMLLIPYAIDTLFAKDRRMWYAILIAVLCILSVITVGEYRFFWEESQDPNLYFRL